MRAQNFLLIVPVRKTCVLDKPLQLIACNRVSANTWQRERRKFGHWPTNTYQSKTSTLTLLKYAQHHDTTGTNQFQTVDILFLFLLLPCPVLKSCSSCSRAALLQALSRFLRSSEASILTEKATVQWLISLPVEEIVPRSFGRKQLFDSNSNNTLDVYYLH